MKHAIIFLILASLLTGCVNQVVKSGGRIIISQTTLGIRVTSTSSTSGTPEFDLGLCKTIIEAEPLSTNILYSANGGYEEDLTQAANPLLFNGLTILSDGYDGMHAGTNAVVVPYRFGVTNLVNTP